MCKDHIRIEHFLVDADAWQFWGKTKRLLTRANLTIWLNMHFGACQFDCLAKYAFWHVPI